MKGIALCMHCSKGGKGIKFVQIVSKCIDAGCGWLPKILDTNLSHEWPQQVLFWIDEPLPSHPNNQTLKREAESPFISILSECKMIF